MKKSKFLGILVIVVVLFVLGYVGFLFINSKQTSLSENYQQASHKIDKSRLSATDAVWVKVTDPRLPIKAIWYPSFGLDSSYDIDDATEAYKLYDKYSTIFSFATQYRGTEQFDIHADEMNIYFEENKSNLTVEQLLSSRYKSDYEKNLWEQADAYEYVEYSNGLKGYMAKNKPLPLELQEYAESEGFAPWVSGFEGISPDGSKIISVIMDNSGEGSIREVTPENEDINYFLHATLERMEF